MVLTLDDAGSPATTTAAHDTAPTAATLARTLRRLGFFPSLATPAFRASADVPRGADRPAGRVDAVAPDWRPL